jgi:hypothetical protein
VFLPKKPSIYELKLLNNGLTQVVNYTENLFQSIQVATDLDSIETDEALYEQGIRVQPATPQSFLEISGHSAEEIDRNEVERMFGSSQKINFFGIYRYVAFYDQFGNIHKEYDESDCKSIEAVNILKQKQQQVP